MRVHGAHTGVSGFICQSEERGGGHVCLVKRLRLSPSLGVYLKKML